MSSVDIQQLRVRIHSGEQRLSDARNRIGSLRDEFTRRWLPQGSEARARIEEELRVLTSAVADLQAELPFLRQHLEQIQAAEDRALRSWQYSKVTIPNRQRPPDTYKDDWVEAERRKRPWIG